MVKTKTVRNIAMRYSHRFCFHYYWLSVLHYQLSVTRLVFKEIKGGLNFQFKFIIFRNFL